LLRESAKCDRAEAVWKAWTGRSIDDYGDDYGLRPKRVPSSTVVVAVVVDRNAYAARPGECARPTASTDGLDIVPMSA